MWLVYLILLVCAGLHGNIGLYRLCMKWGWFQGADDQRGRKNRIKLKRLRNKLIIVFLAVGFVALLIFVIIGLGRKDGEPRQPTRAVQTLGTGPVATEGASEEAPDAYTTHEYTAPGAQAVDESAPPTEEPVTHDSAPALREPDPVHDNPTDDQAAVREQAGDHDEAALETPRGDAGLAEPGKGAAEGEALEDSHGPEEIRLGEGKAQ